MSLEQWPPLLDDLKIDQGIDADDTRDDVLHETDRSRERLPVLRRHVGRYDFGLGTPGDELLPGPDVDMALGTVRLAARWHTRRRSPDALVAMGDLGSGRVPSFDPDIDRMLRVGRFSPSVVA